MANLDLAQEYLNTINVSMTAFEQLIIDAENADEVEKFNQAFEQFQCLFQLERAKMRVKALEKFKVKKDKPGSEEARKIGFIH